MNQIVASVKEIENRESVKFIHLSSASTDIRLIKYKMPKWLNVGDEVYCNFQEASVCVSKDCPGKVSIENKLPGTLKDVRKGESLCELTFDSDVGKVVSLITSDAYENLELEVGCRATMLLRGVDITLEPIITRTKDAS